jgi:hypothetical protein
MRRIKVVLNLPRTDNGVIFAMKHIADCMDGNAYFPSPPLPIATFRAHIAVVQAAQAATLTRAKGTAPSRDDKLTVIRSDADLLRVYVETVANQSPEHGPAIVASAGMYEKGSSGPRRGQTYARQEPTSGSVHLLAPHPGGDASFEWQWSTDQTTWTTAGTSTQADFRITGLTPGLLYYFRVQVLTKGGLGDWSAPFALRVV